MENSDLKKKTSLLEKENKELNKVLRQVIKNH